MTPLNLEAGFVQKQLRKECVDGSCQHTKQNEKKHRSNSLKYLRN